MPVTPEEMMIINVSDSSRRQSLWPKLSFVLAIVGWLIIGSTLNTIIFNSFPLMLAAPTWQLNLIAAILSSCSAFLVGAVLIALALALNPKDKVLQKWQLAMSRLAGLFAIFLIFTIPAQFFLGSRILKEQVETTNLAIKNLKDNIRGISSASSETELRAYVASLPDPPKLPAKFDVAFPEIQKRAIDNINAQINAAANGVEIQKSQNLQRFLQEAFRNTAQAILMSAGFSVLANISRKASNSLTKLFESVL